MFDAGRLLFGFFLQKSTGHVSENHNVAEQIWFAKSL